MRACWHSSYPAAHGGGCAPPLLGHAWEVCQERHLCQHAARAQCPRRMLLTPASPSPPPTWPVESLQPGLSGLRRAAIKENGRRDVPHAGTSPRYHHPQGERSSPRFWGCGGRWRARGGVLFSDWQRWDLGAWPMAHGQPSRLPALHLLQPGPPAFLLGCIERRGRLLRPGQGCAWGRWL